MSFITEPSDVPLVKTLAVYEVGDITAMVSGEVVSDGGGDILREGMCWSTVPDFELDILER